jgi:cell division protein FtsI (penicillin-binding protein 3)/stage V sporulation protein D (sporulation-specific penicillin-binding protein)
MTRVVNSRIRLLLLATFVAFAALLAREAWIATVRAAPLAAMAEEQANANVTLPAGRGTVFDAVGTPLALGEQATTVYADPHQVRNAHSEAVVAARILGLKVKPIERVLADKSFGFVYVERKAPPNLATRLAQKKLAGFGFYGEERRSYPQGSVGAQVLGFAGVDNQGLAGLELQLNSELTGVTGHETLVRDPLGQPISIGKVVPARPGKDVFLTVDHTIQANAEQVLRETVAKFHAKDATAIVLDPHTGGVLAMATEPGYNANDYPQAFAKGLTVNRAISDVYEPGSVFKVVTIGGALADHLVTPQTKFTVPYSLHVADRVIHDAEIHPTERMTVAQILQQSSNVGTVTIAETKLGQTRLKQWIHRYGFGQQTGIDFPGESAGLLPPFWSGSTIGTVPIGQGISVTAIQLASVYGAIANGGLWVQPHLVDHIQGTRTPTPKTRRILPRGIDHELLSMLKGVVSDTGTGEAAAIPGYDVAGKTGTAQKPGSNGYIPGAYVATFVGMVPARAPRLVVLVTVDQPLGEYYGGVVAAPAFAQIAEFDLQYLEVPPDQPVK